MSESRYSVVNRERTPPFDERVDPLNVSAFARYGEKLIAGSRALREASVNRQMASQARRSADISAQSVEARSKALSELRGAYQRTERQEAVQRQLQQQAKQSQHQVLQQQTSVVESRRRVEDDILKRIADVRLTPFAPGQELEEASAATLRARLNLCRLNRVSKSQSSGPASASWSANWRRSPSARCRPAPARGGRPRSWPKR